MRAEHGPDEGRRPGLIIATGVAHSAGGGQSQCIACSNPNNPDRASFRAQRGCDAPTDHVQFEIDCPWCRGSGCVECESHGSLQFHRCVHHYYGPQHLDVIRSVAMLECGVLPCAGGWTDQSATWVDAVGIVRREIDDYRRKAAKEA